MFFYYIFCLFLEKGILDYIARRPIIQTFYGSGRANRTPLSIERVIGHEDGMGLGCRRTIKTWTLRGPKGIFFVIG